MNMKNIVYKILGLFLITLCLGACSDDDFTESIFVDEPPLDPGSATYDFDKWLETTYLEPFNLDFRYKMQDIGSDMDYNLIPTKLDQSKNMAILIKYLWFDVYSKVVEEDFLKKYGPRIIHLIGSPAYNPNLGTIVLGTAEGGIKVTLYRCNELDQHDVDMMNEYYFKTMHHEFAHILHQQRSYPSDYQNFSAGYYSPTGWQTRTLSEAASLGFVSPYGGSQPREDFVEVIANYIVKTKTQWDYILELASKPGVKEDGTIVDDPLDGRSIILSKLEICRLWLQKSWNIDLEELRNEVQERQLHIDEILSETYW